MWTHVELELSTPDEIDTLPKFDFTKLSAINTCPTWGILRYTQHKAMPTNARAMALEAGTVMHECFAAIRLIQLGHEQGQAQYALMHRHGARIFGYDRWQSMLVGYNPTDFSIAMRNVGLECLSTSGFVDDGFDKRRTYNNLETALLYYIQRWDKGRYPIWIDRSDDWVGIEIPFSITITATRDDGPTIKFIYTGRIDGLHVSNGEVIIQENKTASRLDEAWSMSFDMSHQVTGYMIAASLWSKQVIERGLVIGLSIPLPKTMSSGLSIVSVRREQHNKERWFRWLEHTIELHNKYEHDILTAPQYTHSCNRYFRPCSFIPFCASDDDERRLILSEMVHDEWTPLTEKAGD